MAVAVGVGALVVGGVASENAADDAKDAAKKDRRAAGQQADAANELSAEQFEKNMAFNREVLDFNKRVSDRDYQAAIEARNYGRKFTDRRYSDARTTLTPFMTSERGALDQYETELGLRPGESRFMMTPAYQRMQEAGIGAVNQGAANEGTLYSGPRYQSLRDVGQQVFASAYGDYMSSLRELAQPRTTSQFAGISTGQPAAPIVSGGQQVSTPQVSYTGYATPPGGTYMAAAGATNAARSDFMGGLSNLASAYMMSNRNNSGFSGGATNNFYDSPRPTNSTSWMSWEGQQYA